MEMIEDPSQRIGRPRQLYTGAAERAYILMENR
jgi:citrate synthase